MRTAAPKASMASTAVRSATVPTGAAATASTGPASVTRGSTAASATWPARHGPLGQAAQRSASVSSRIRVRAIRGMAAVPARRASGASGARMSASRASLGQGAGRRAPAPRAWPATLSVASVGSSVPLVTTGRTAAKSAQQGRLARTAQAPAPVGTPPATGSQGNVCAPRGGPGTTVGQIVPRAAGGLAARRSARRVSTVPPVCRRLEPACAAPASWAAAARMPALLAGLDLAARRSAPVPTMGSATQ